MKKYEPIFQERESKAGSALQGIAVITAICGFFAGFMFITDNELTIGFLMWISSAITAIFTWGFAEVIFLLTDIKYKVYEEVDDEEVNLENPSIDEELPDL